MIKFISIRDRIHNFLISSQALLLSEPLDCRIIQIPKLASSCINDGQLVKKRWAHKFWEWFSCKIFTHKIWKAKAIVSYRDVHVHVHDDTWDGKKERKTSEAMKKWKWVASGGIWTHDVLHSEQMLLPTELPRQPSWPGPNLTSHTPMYMYIVHNRT